MLKPPLKPMLLKTKTEPFDSEDFLFEFKWDGFRSILFINNQKLYLQSRKGKDLTPYFPELLKIGSLFKHQNLILDGEICYINEKGETVFSILQKRLRSKKRKKLAVKFPVTLIIWDILNAGKTDIFNRPLRERKEILADEIQQENERLQLSIYLEKEGNKMYNLARKHNMEGIVAKELESKYEFRRSEKWFKIKIWKYTETYIGGYTGQKTGLLVGKFDDKKNLNYLGKIKLSLPAPEKKALFNFLPRIKSKQNPFVKSIENKDIIWVKPVVSCKVKYKEITRDNSFRHGYAVKLLF